MISGSLPARLARISHHLTVEVRNKPAVTALRLLTVLNVLHSPTVLKTSGFPTL